MLESSRDVPGWGKIVIFVATNTGQIKWIWVCEDRLLSKVLHANLTENIERCRNPFYAKAIRHVGPVNIARSSDDKQPLRTTQNYSSVLHCAIVHRR